MQSMQTLLFVLTKSSSMGTGKAVLWGIFLCPCNSIIGLQSPSSVSVSALFLHLFWSLILTFFLFHTCRVPCTKMHKLLMMEMLILNIFKLQLRKGESPQPTWYWVQNLENKQTKKNNNKTHFFFVTKCTIHYTSYAK